MPHSRAQRFGNVFAWREERWPHLPRDFDFAYWNAAPEDQQLESLPPDARVELTNLVAPEHARDGVLRASLPGHRALTLLRLTSGVLIPLPMEIDTLVVDAEALQVEVVWRVSFPAAMDVRVAEARFELDPKAPLIRFEAPAP